MKKAAYILWGVSAVLLVIALNLSWALRDGWGPDAVTSEGREAWHYALERFDWPSRIIISLPVLIGAILWKFQNRQVK